MLFGVLRPTGRELYHAIGTTKAESITDTSIPRHAAMTVAIIARRQISMCTSIRPVAYAIRLRNNYLKIEEPEKTRAISMGSESHLLWRGTWAWLGGGVERCSCGTKWSHR